MVLIDYFNSKIANRYDRITNLDNYIRMKKKLIDVLYLNQRCWSH